MTFTPPVYHDYPYSPLIESFIKILQVILGILGVFGWCFLCLGLFGFVVYLNERRKENNET